MAVLLPPYWLLLQARMIVDIAFGTAVSSPHWENDLPTFEPAVIGRMSRRKGLA
jgi:hypothetical protein